MIHGGSVRGKAVTKNVLLLSSSFYSSLFLLLLFFSYTKPRSLNANLEGQARHVKRSIISQPGSSGDFSSPFPLLLLLLLLRFRLLLSPFPLVRSRCSWPGHGTKAHVTRLASVTSDARDSRKPFQTPLSIAAAQPLPITPGLREFFL